MISASEVTGLAVREHGVVALTPAAVVNIDPTLAGKFTLTPGQTETLNMLSLIPGQEITLFIKTSGTSSYTLTFGSKFKTTGTLATGTVDAKIFVMKFSCDGVNYNEISRTTAM